MARIIKMDMNQWTSYMGKLEHRFMPAMVRGIQAGAARLLPELHNRTRQASPASERGTPGALDTGLYLAGWRSAPLLNGAMVYNVRPYSPVIERGRRPAPVGRGGIRNLEAWVHRKLKLSGSEARAAAFAIAQTLKKRKLKPRKVLTGDEDALIKIVEEEVMHELDLELGR